MQPENRQIGIMAQDEAYANQASTLASQLAIPLVSSPLTCDLLLTIDTHGISLRTTTNSNQVTTIQVDFTKGTLQFRQKKQQQELLIRAVGYKQGTSLSVIDGTGGLGRDSFILAAAGCSVDVFEQNSIIATLLADGLKRAATHPDTAAIIRRITLHKKNVIPFLLKQVKTGKNTDVIYLDPMFPKRRKSALVKKDLQLIQLLAAQPNKPDTLLETALATASQRVVVKRPHKAPPLTTRKPSHTIAGKNIRFDVYMIHAR